MWHLHFHFPHFFLFVSSVALLPKQAISVHIWQKHDKQSISSELVHAAPTIPRCTLSVGIVHRHTYCFTIAQTLLRPSIVRPAEAYWHPALLDNFELWCKKKKKEKKKKSRWMENYAALDSALFWVTVHLSPLFFAQWTMHKMTRNPALNTVCSLPKNLSFTRVWLVFICTRLSECQNWI